MRRGDIFFGDGDRALYLRLMREQTEKFGVRILCYCLMTNHVHLLAVPDTAGKLASAIGEAHRRTTRQLNRRDACRRHVLMSPHCAPIWHSTATRRLRWQNKV